VPIIEQVGPARFSRTPRQPDGRGRSGHGDGTFARASVPSGASTGEHEEVNCAMAVRAMAVRA